MKTAGFCDAHYRQWQKTGKAEGEVREKIPPTEGCTVEGCQRPHCAKGLCSMHWQRKRRGSELGGVERMRALPGERSLNGQGYVVIGTPGGPMRRVLEHRMLMEQLLGRPLKRHETVHHANGQRDDNRINGPLVNYRSGNLELWSSWQPSGQAVEDKVAYAVELLATYAPSFLARSENNGVGVERSKYRPATDYAA